MGITNIKSEAKVFIIVIPPMIIVVVSMKEFWTKHLLAFMYKIVGQCI